MEKKIREEQAQRSWGIPAFRGSRAQRIRTMMES